MIVIDTGPLVAAVDADSKDHRTCASLLDERADELIVPASVVVETCWMLARLVGTSAEAELLASIADGELRVEQLVAADYARAGQLVTTYRDLDLGMVDASVVAIAERFGAGEIATLDRRDFSVVRPQHVDAFGLLP
jgi:uncharacterized protein